ncbi:AlpA family transcriptional regulator [Massilia sp. R798]|uniref:AlpA family transcriptional regulator n=2 Tax=Massilia soli TaxID=2792854 RepID=A0ABS7SVZ5_9BURK|nr:AlpA family transcriptional regulator [Massilia soli]
MTNPCDCDIRLIRIDEVIEITGLSRAAVYRMIQKGEFPRQVRLSVRSSAWVLQEVREWAFSRVSPTGLVD